MLRDELLLLDAESATAAITAPTLSSSVQDPTVSIMFHLLLALL